MPPRHHRPPWWPEHEPWPPQGAPWQVNRRAFIWRLGFALALFLIFFATLTALGAHFFDRSWEGKSDDRPTFWFLFPLTILFIIVAGVVFASRRIGRTIRPVFDLIDASYKVSEGDYSRRVEPSGNVQLQNLIHAFNNMTGKLEISDQQRRRLLADIAHELRTPLAVIQGNVEGLIDGVYPLDVEHLQPLLRESQMISRLLDDLQTLSRAESGVLDLYWESTDLRLLLADIVAAFQQRAHGAGIDLQLVPGDATHDTDHEVDVDPMRLRQVVENILSNAIRHTPDGQVIAVSLGFGPTQASIVVRDTGQGIAGDVLPFIFDRFVKSADSGGSGLGLAIAKRLVEAHGGTITARSASGAGTTIEIQLPTSQPTNP
ncbi:MAG: HAMP domain-containing sensor histidine kinase [Thermomicrobiales bacterium]